MNFSARQFFTCTNLFRGHQQFFSRSPTFILKNHELFYIKNVENSSSNFEIDCATIVGWL
jgi:hypothetical protein